MTDVVMFLTNDDGEKEDNRRWHYVFKSGGSPCKLCTLEPFGEGESTATYKQKSGKITCPLCIEIIDEIKSIPNSDLLRKQ